MTDQRPEPEYHLDIPLDDPPATREPVYVDVVARTHELQPVIPAQWRRGNITGTVRYHAGRTVHRAKYHSARSPRYLLLAAMWAVVGVGRLVVRQFQWWLDTNSLTMENAAVRTLDQKGWEKSRGEGNDRRRTRGRVLLAELVGLVVVVLVLVYLAPGWVIALVVACAVPPLAHIGRPVDKRIVNPAVVTPRFRRINPDIVLRAYYAAGLGNAAKGERVDFGSSMARDGNGSAVLIDLPYGKGVDDAVRARPAIASGLDVSLSQVFISRDPTSQRRHRLWVADRDPLAIPAGRTPLLRRQPTDIWTPAPFGLDERGNRVNVQILWNSILIGAQPRQGKTFSARALGLYAALDPYCRVTVLDAGGKPDWRGFSKVADRFAFGLAMTRQGDPVEIVIDTLRAIKADVQERYEKLSALPADICPEGKLTREIARDPRYGMPVHVVLLDEFQEYFDLGEATKEIAPLLVYLVKVAPAAGVSLIDATQRPSGIGTGQVAQQFISFRDNHQVRFSLRTGSWQMSDLVLGAGAYSEGYDSSTLLPTYKGVGILRGADDDTPTVRTYLADQEDAEKILTAARGLRERAGTLSGMAAGEDMTRQARDVLRDVDGVFYAGEAWISWQQLATRLAEQLPEAYAGTTAEAISAQVRGLGAAAKKGKQDGASLWGVPREQVHAALKRREIEGRV